MKQANLSRKNFELNRIRALVDDWTKVNGVNDLRHLELKEAVESILMRTHSLDALQDFRTALAKIVSIGYTEGYNTACTDSFKETGSKAILRLKP